MKLLAPRPHGPGVWIYTSTLGGGFVAGDCTRLDLRLGADARCFVGSQATTRIYRNPARRPCRHTTRAELGSRSLLVFAPDPVQAFADSTFAQRQDFTLAPDASLVLLDWMTSGRAACGERWHFSHYSTRNTVRFHTPDAESDSRTASANPTLPTPAFLDGLCLDPAHGSLASIGRGRQFNCLATLLLAGPLTAAAARDTLERVRQEPLLPRPALCLSASPWRDGAVLRAAGEHVEPVRHWLAAQLESFSPWLGGNPWSRHNI
jgi:urease accessory protein